MLTTTSNGATTATVSGNYIHTQPCWTCYCNPCICNQYTYYPQPYHTYTYPSYPDMSGIEEKLDKIIKLLTPEGIEEIEQESDELKRNLEEVIAKYGEMLKELANL